MPIDLQHLSKNVRGPRLLLAGAHADECRGKHLTPLTLHSKHTCTHTCMHTQHINACVWLLQGARGFGPTYTCENSKEYCKNARSQALQLQSALSLASLDHIFFHSTADIVYYGDCAWIYFISYIAEIHPVTKALSEGAVHAHATHASKRAMAGVVDRFLSPPSEYHLGGLILMEEALMEVALMEVALTEALHPTEEDPTEVAAGRISPLCPGTCPSSNHTTRPSAHGIGKTKQVRKKSLATEKNGRNPHIHIF